MAVVLKVFVVLILVFADRQTRPQLVRGWIDVNDDEEIQKALKFAMTEYNKASNDVYISKVHRIISLKKQYSKTLIQKCVATPNDAMPLCGDDVASPPEEETKEEINRADIMAGKERNEVVHNLDIFVQQDYEMVVAGMKYLMKVEIVTTSCKKSKFTMENCPNKGNTSKIKRCTFEVLSVPWLKITKLTQNICR